MVAHGEQGLRRLVGHLDAAVEVRLPHFSGRRAAGGRPAGVAGEVRLPRFSGKACGQERGSTLEEEKTHHFSFFPCCTSRGGRKRNNVVQNDTVLIFSFFFLYETASF